MAFFYGTLFITLGGWSTYTTFRTRDAWQRHRLFLSLEILFIASCFLPGGALLLDAFKKWMLLPIGVCYLGLLRFPCYFAWVDRGWVRRARDFLFLVVGLFFIAVGIGWVPLEWVGL